MAVWAYACRLCDGDQQPLFVSQAAIDAMPVDVRIVRLKLASQWLCAMVHRDQRVEVDGMLVREAIPSDPLDCPECTQAKSTPPTASAAGETADLQKSDVEQTVDDAGSSAQLLVAACTLQEVEVIVVLVTMAVIESAGEAEMLVSDLRARFNQAAIVLVAQDEQGSPNYSGSPELVERLREIPLDELPWRTLTLS